MKITTIGIDLAKNVFQIHGVDEGGKVMARRNKNVAAVALANKNARIVWALLAHDRIFRADYEFAQTANS